MSGRFCGLVADLVEEGSIGRSQIGRRLGGGLTELEQAPERAVIEQHQ